MVPACDRYRSYPIAIGSPVCVANAHLCVKIYGDSLAYTEKKAYEVNNAMKNIIHGVEDLGVIRNIGQPELRIDLDQNKMALYGVTTADANATIEMAIGGKAVSQIYEGEKKFRLRLRYQEDYRNNAEAISNLVFPLFFYAGYRKLGQKMD